MHQLFVPQRLLRAVGEIQIDPPRGGMRFRELGMRFQTAYRPDPHRTPAHLPGFVKVWFLAMRGCS